MTYLFRYSIFVQRIFCHTKITNNTSKRRKERPRISTMHYSCVWLSDNMTISATDLLFLYKCLSVVHNSIDRNIFMTYRTKIYIGLLKA